MLAQSVSRNDLAKATGLQPDTITNVVGGSCKAKRCRQAVEQALNMPIWSSLNDFLEVKKAINGCVSQIFSTSKHSLSPRAKPGPRVVAAKSLRANRPLYMKKNRRNHPNEPSAKNP